MHNCKVTSNLANHSLYQEHLQNENKVSRNETSKPGLMTKHKGLKAYSTKEKII